MDGEKNMLSRGHQVDGPLLNWICCCASQALNKVVIYRLQIIVAYAPSPTNIQRGLTPTVRNSKPDQNAVAAPFESI